MNASCNGNCVESTTPIMTAPNTTRNLASCWCWNVNNDIFNESYYLNGTKICAGALSKFCDMLLNVPLVAEWKQIIHNRGALVNNFLLKSNQWCINYYYFVGQQVLKYENTIKGKLEVKTSSPFEIVCICVNGTITIQLRADVTNKKKHLSHHPL